jgi:DNA-binding LytR/AlgR family response regulator
MRIAICDDKTEQIQIIDSSVKAYFSAKHRNDYELFSFCKSFDFLDEQEKNPFDLVLLDICMPGMLGTDVAKEIRKKKKKTEIIFITTSYEFAVEAFSIQAAHYLVKPFSQKEFDEDMNRVLEKTDKLEDKSLTVKGSNGYTTISLNSVLYAESDSHNLTIHCLNEEVTARMNLNDFYHEVHKLRPGLFIMPVKGFVVNLSHIKTLKPNEMIIEDGKIISISQRLHKEVKDVYFDYRFNANNHEWNDFSDN